MDASAIIMFVIGAVFLWGGVLVAIVNYARASRRSPD
ncbi:MAG: MetS family NSS transporter small subunit [Propionibacteriales bacterium]|nr:MetS family NSS transporter small subunit [Propionibacteriales bacterium]